MNITDYTKKPSTVYVPMFPSRFGSYLLDLLKSWFSDPRNRIDPKLAGLNYIDGDTPETIDASKVYLDVAWPDDQRLVEKTPAVIITFGAAKIHPRGIGAVKIHIGHAPFQGESTVFEMSYNIALNVRTTGYTGCQYLTEMLGAYLSNFSGKIQNDAKLSTFFMETINPPEMQKQEYNSKDLFTATIVLSVSVVYTSVVDTTGPTFRGVTMSNGN